MSLWEITSPPWPTDTFHKPDPTEVLAEYDCLLTFTFRDRAANLMLAHLAGADGGLLRYIVAPTTDDIVDKLKTGAVSVRRALDQPIVWLVDFNSHGEAVRCWSQKVQDLPTGAAPNNDVMLYPELEPLIRLRATGEAIKPGHIPSSSIRSAIAGVENAIRKLTHFASQRGVAGRPEEWYRQLYQLDVQEFAFNSISIAFRRSTQEGSLLGGESGLYEDILRRVESMLEQGLIWSQTGEGLSDEDGEAEAILDAVKEISPSAASPTMAIEVSGRVASKRAIRLTPTIRKHANEESRRYRKRRSQAEVIASRGEVREADKDKLSFILRNRPGNEPEITFTFSDEQSDAVMDAFYGEYEVFVLGRSVRDGACKLLELVDLDDPGNIGADEQRVSGG